jgi:signal peptide peptidase SppA
MKQLPRISAMLYATPWSILPESHAELSRLYRSYLQGTLPAMPESRTTEPAAVEGRGYLGSGIVYDTNPAAGICVITLEGVISKRPPDLLCGPPMVDLSLLDELIEDLANDDRISTVVLVFDSPGGSVIGLEETASAIRELATEKRLVAYTDVQMCSAAYYLAAACDEIYAASSSCIGSIGTYIALLDDSRAWEMEGLELKLFRVGNLKAIGHPGKKMTPDEEKFLQDTAEAAGGEFRSWVTRRRPDVEESNMQGQWFFAKSAPKGLVDGLYNNLAALLAALMADAETA